MITTTALAMDLGERIAYAGRMTLIGMVTIFAALSILWGALVLFRIGLRAAEDRKRASAPTATPATKSAVSAHPATNEEETVAAITAAITVMLAEENGGSAPVFRVVSFRRTRNNRQ